MSPADFFKGNISMAKKGKLSRRSFLTRVAGGTIAAGVIGTAAGAAIIQQRNSDADPADSGGRPRTGVNDNDPGDPSMHGRGRTGYTDSDSGPCADTGGYGRGNTGYTDSDSSGCADPGGRGRGASI